MANSRNSFLHISGNILLVLAVLNLSQGCTVFRCVEKQSSDGIPIEKYNNQGRYFILYSENGVHHLSDIRIVNNTIMATLSELSQEHILYRIKPGEKPGEQSKLAKETLAREVVLVTNLEIPANDTTVVLPMSVVDHVYIYGTRLTKGSVAVIVIFSMVGLFVVSVTVALAFSPGVVVIGL